MERNSLPCWKKAKSRSEDQYNLNCSSQDFVQDFHEMLIFKGLYRREVTVRRRKWRFDAELQRPVSFISKSDIWFIHFPESSIINRWAERSRFLVTSKMVILKIKKLFILRILTITTKADYLHVPLWTTIYKSWG